MSKHFCSDVSGSFSLVRTDLVSFETPPRPDSSKPVKYFLPFAPSLTATENSRPCVSDHFSHSFDMMTWPFDRLGPHSQPFMQHVLRKKHYSTLQKNCHISPYCGTQSSKHKHPDRQHIFPPRHWVLILLPCICCFPIPCGRCFDFSPLVNVSTL